MIQLSRAQIIESLTDYAIRFDADRWLPAAWNALIRRYLDAGLAALRVELVEAGSEQARDLEILIDLSRAGAAWCAAIAKGMADPEDRYSWATLSSWHSRVAGLAVSGFSPWIAVDVARGAPVAPTRYQPEVARALAMRPDPLTLTAGESLAMLRGIPGGVA